MAGRTAVAVEFGAMANKAEPKGAKSKTLLRNVDINLKATGSMAKTHIGVRITNAQCLTLRLGS